MVNTKYLLYGASGHARVVEECIKANDFKLVGVYDDDTSINSFNSIPFLGKYNKDKHKYPLIISIGDNEVRKRIAKRIKWLYGSVCHPSAHISGSTDIGEGSVVFHQAIIQVCCKIGNHVIVNTGASIDHECIIGDFVHISPQATLCGNVKVGEGTLIGANATILPGLSIGNWVKVGAGAVIINDVPDNSVVVGNPGKIIKSVENLIL